MRTFNITTQTKMNFFKTQVWALLCEAYSQVPGGINYSSVDELMLESCRWSLAIEHGQVKAVTVFKKKHGLKMVAFAKSREAGSTAALIALLNDALRIGWMELSDKAEAFVMKHCNGKHFLLHHFLVHQLLADKNISLNVFSSYHYNRSILGRIKTKVALGTPKLAAAAAA
ncbi:MAG: hypothetical protein WAO12_00630 [Venatoribacter sp.]